MLLKALCFCLIPHYIKLEVVLNDLESCFSCLHLKEFFLEEEEGENSDAKTLFLPWSTCVAPKSRDAAHRTDVEFQLANLWTKRCSDYLLLNKRSALRSLSQPANINTKAFYLGIGTGGWRNVERCSLDFGDRHKCFDRIALLCSNRFRNSGSSANIPLLTQ